MVILGWAFLLTMSGCIKNAGHIDTDKMSSETTEFVFLEENHKGTGENNGINENGGKKVAWNDNKLDDYHAVINHIVEKVEVEGENHLGSVPFVAEGGCVRHGKHYFGDYRKSWDGVNGISANGEKFETKVEVDPGREGVQIQSLGSISGKDGYVACFGDYQDGKYWNDLFYELDQNFQVIRSVQTELGGHDYIHGLMGDKDGNFHLLYDAGNQKMNYLVISSEGEVFFEKEVEDSALCAFGKGRIALCETFSKTRERRLSEANLKTGELSELFVSRDETVKERLKQPFDVYDIVPVDENQAILCTVEEISLYDAIGKKAKSLYVWSNHGIIPSSITQMTMTANGCIEVLYKEGNSTDYIYLLLVPTDEKEELKTITIATTPYNTTYDKMAAYFQKLYPQYVIQVKKDYDEVSLLTQLGAGDGPVLVDTSLTGFEDLDKLWQPLDGFLEQTGLAEELLPKTLEFGKIGGVTYGIVQQFWIETLLVPETRLTNWDYEGFLNALENFDGMAYADVNAQTWSDQRNRYFDLLNNGVTDNYYFDAETGKTIFGTQAFEKVLRLSKKAVRNPSSEAWSAILEGKALCEHEYVSGVQNVIHLRRKLEAKGVRAIGYPTKDGARHRLVSGAALTVRRTATDEEKMIAYTFLKACLSKEAIDSLDLKGFTVRKDILEEAFQSYQEQVDLAKSMDAYFSYDPEEWPELDWVEDTKFLYNMMENSVIKKQLPAGLKGVFDEEFGDYIDGRIGEKALDDHLKSRVWLYLEEEKSN